MVITSATIIKFNFSLVYGYQPIILVSLEYLSKHLVAMVILSFCHYSINQDIQSCVSRNFSLCQVSVNASFSR